MTVAFKASLPSTQKFVLIALCDSANDQGECYPSVRLVSEKCCLAERTVQEAINSLEVAGYVRRHYRTGRSTVYLLSATPAVGAPPQLAHPTPADCAPTPADCAPPPPQLAHPTPAVGAPITIKESLIEPLPKQKKRLVEVVEVEVLIEAGFDRFTAEEFITCKADRKAPLTIRAWKDHLRESEKAGWSPQAAAEKVMAKTWKGFEAKYVEATTRLATRQKTFAEIDAENTAAQIHKMTGGLMGKPKSDSNTIEMEAINGARPLLG